MRTAASEEGVDERRDRAALREHEQAAHQREHEDDGQQPVFPALAHESPQLGQERDHAAQNCRVMVEGGGPGGRRSIQYVEAEGSRRRWRGSFPRTRKSSPSGATVVKNTAPMMTGLVTRCRRAPRASQKRLKGASALGTSIAAPTNTAAAPSAHQRRGP